jgi:hypothetical protein
MNSLTKTPGNVFPSIAANGLANVANGTVNAVANAANGTAEAITNAANGTANAVANVANNVGNSLFAIGNTAKNAAKSVANVANNMLPNSITTPINASIQATPEPETLWVTIPLILAIGALIIGFTLLVVFKDQIQTGFEVAWTKLSNLFGFSSTPTSIPEQAYIPDDSSTSNLVEKVLPGRKEVFNVAENHYRFSDAEPLCKALGAELATYEQVKDAWNSGADWCNYGWVKGQAAVYPTQQTTFDKLQNEGTEDERLACGQVGINGGYFDNPDLRFGVNCYGNKPVESEHSMANIMKSEGQPMTPEAIAFDKKVLNYKAHSNEIAINPYKPGVWSN